jgi:phage recombination protein Bet
MTERTITKPGGGHMSDEDVAATLRQNAQPTAIAPMPDQLPEVVITAEQVDLIKATIAPDATDVELRLFFYDCKRRGVHPLDKLIHFTKRGGKYTPVTSIDFFRSRAAESREHMGTDDAVFTGENTPDFAATVTVYREVKGWKCPFTATARWAEYLPDEKNNFMWLKMPHGQLAKCAEALALRKAFPQQLGDLHTFEEMDQARNDPPREPKPVGSSTTAPVATPIATPERKTGAAPAKISEQQDKRIFAIAMGAGWSKEQLRDWLKKTYGIEHTRDLTRDVYDEACRRVEHTEGAR